MTKKILVTSARLVKSGQGQYGPWNLYAVTDQDQVKYSTFESEWMNRVNTEHEIEYEEKTETKGDKTYTNRTILKKKAPQADPKILRYIEDLYAKLKLIEARITTLEQQSNEELEMDEDFGPQEVPPPTATDLPF